MDIMALLTSDELIKELDTIPNWRCADDSASISICFTFSSFASAMGFMMQMAIIVDRMNHHPDWSNSYNSVSVSLSTHDVGGVSSLDISLARAMDKAAAMLGAKIS